MIDLITGHQGIPHISAEQISTLHRSLMGSNGDNKVVRMKDGGVTSVGLTVSIATGYWRVHGYDMQIQEAEAVIFDPTEAGYQRIDDLFVEILQDISSGVQRSELVIVQGEPSTTTPIAPAAPTEAASEYDLLVECVPVCSVLVIEGAMTMTDLTIPFKVSSGGSESIAPEFDPERPEPYEIGEIVEQEGKLYIFTRQHSGPWNDADVEETTVAALLAEVNNELSAIENVYGAKNLIPYPCNQFSRTNNGITFTDNGDGTVTANGTATADASYNISQRFGVSGGSFSLKNGNYLLSGCESGSNTTFFIQTGVTKNNVFSLLNKNFDGDTAITVDGDDNSNDSANIAVQIVIRSGQTLTNKVFKPMIRLASIQDDTWVPYAKTNKELTDDVNEIDEDLESTMDLIRGDDDEYSSLKSYKVGQYVVVKPPLVEKETIYKCISPCSPGSWAINQSHFEAKTLTEAVTDLNNELNAQHRRKRKSISANDLRACITNDGVDLSIKDITIGDYITINSNYKAVVADIDTFYGGYDSYAVVNSHHIAMLIVGTAGSVTQKWNSSNTTSSGYNGSALHTALKNLISTIEGTLGTLISHQKLLTTATSNWAWQASQKISALTESQIYGAPIWSIDGYQQGEAWKQLEIFRKFSFNEIFGNQSVWLRSIQSASPACVAAGAGHALHYGASAALGVVGLVLFH